MVAGGALAPNRNNATLRSGGYVHPRRCSRRVAEDEVTRSHARRQDAASALLLLGKMPIPGTHDILIRCVSYLLQWLKLRPRHQTCMLYI